MHTVWNRGLRVMALGYGIGMAMGPEAAEGRERDAYGGIGPPVSEGNGCFQVAAQDGVWWLVTPEGNRFLSKGVNHVTYNGDRAPDLGFSPYQRAVQEKYGSESAWAEAVCKRLKYLGFNTLGTWSSPSTHDQGMPYTVVLNLAGEAGANWQHGTVGDFFSPDFESRIREACRKKCGPRKDDPWLIGYFTDNEPNSWVVTHVPRQAFIDQLYAGLT